MDYIIPSEIYIYVRRQILFISIFYIVVWSKMNFYLELYCITVFIVKVEYIDDIFWIISCLNKMITWSKFFLRLIKWI